MMSQETKGERTKTDEGETAEAVTLDKVVARCKRRGFIFQSSEIYGGLGSTYDYGHYGVLLKNNVKAEWWRANIQQRDDMVALDAAILMHPKTWEASGHLEGFTDPLVQCLGDCKKRWREDHVREEQLGAEDAEGEIRCPECGGELSEPMNFNLMFETHMGPTRESGSEVYLRPETAQGIFVNFKNVLQFARKKPPFGIAQIGKAFRNEITPGNFIFRTREFEQMEMQFFVEPGTDEAWMEHWMEQRMAWVRSLGIREEKLRFHEHGPDELAHYAKSAFDIEYELPFGWQEFEGIHNRTDFDLTRHQEYAGKKLEYVDPVDRDKRYIPYVIETSAGADRTALVVLADAYREDEVEGEQRVLLALHPKLAPIKLAVFPLVKKDGLPELAAKLHEDLRARGIPSFYDESGSIGKRYRRQDEAGTPFCATIDGQTNEDGTVTIRDRDTLEQERVGIERVVEWVVDRVA
jgi:glycyl-tRNA synthetase